MIIKAHLLFKKIEGRVPLKLAFKGDNVGFIGQKDAADNNIDRILVMMDYISPQYAKNINYSDYDLLILHHPPLEKPVIPAYVIHSNWDVVDGGCCDALADCLNIRTDEIFDENLNLGKIGKYEGGEVLLSDFTRHVQNSLKVDNIRLVNNSGDCLIEKIGIIPGFGLNPKFINLAIKKGIDLFLSGDLTHPGAILAKNSDVILMDAAHYATELPGLYRLEDLISEYVSDVVVMDTKTPWDDICKEDIV